MRQFTTGATRDDETGKNDYEGFLSPLVIRRFGDYMTLHRKQADGQMRDSDNWQKGMERSVYLKSMFRHFLDLWSIWRGHTVLDSKDAHKITKDEACCAILFNIMGFLHEELKADSPLDGIADHLIKEFNEMEIPEIDDEDCECASCKPKPLGNDWLTGPVQEALGNPRSCKECGEGTCEMCGKNQTMICTKWKPANEVEGTVGFPTKENK